MQQTLGELRDIILIAPQQLIATACPLKKCNIDIKYTLLLLVLIFINPITNQLNIQYIFILALIFDS